MVTNATNFSRSDLHDWMAQRVSVVVLVAYVILLLGYLIAHPNISHTDWYGLLSQGWVCIFSLLTLVALSVHAQASMWIISTDYLTSMALGKVVTVVRSLFQTACGMAMFAFSIWGVQIPWNM